MARLPAMPPRILPLLVVCLGALLTGCPGSPASDAGCLTCLDLLPPADLPSDPRSDPSTGPIDTAPDAVGDAGAIDDGGADAAIPASAFSGELPLEVLRQEGHPARLYVPVRHDGIDGFFLVDTGSQLTLIPLGADQPDYIPEAGTVELGGQRVIVAGRRTLLSESHQGLPVLGILGNDVLLARPWELDLPGGRLFAPADLAAYEGWAVLPFENVHDFLFARLEVDGTPLRMGVDTGAVHLLWLGVEGEPGDIPRSTQDASGTPVTLYQGTAAVVLAGEPDRTVPILRTPSFPSLEESNRLVGGQIDGLIGLSTLGDRRLLLQGPDLQIRLEPRPPSP